LADYEEIPDIGEVLPITLERFAPSELVLCPNCDRGNSPKRSTCIYCGAELGVVTVSETEPDQPISATETGGYFLPSDQLARVTEENAARIADLLQVKVEDLQRAISAGGPLPLFGSASAAERPRLPEEIAALGLQLVRVPPEATSNHAWRKTRALVLTEEAISTSPAENGMVLPWLDLILVVIGRIVQSRVEQEENRRRNNIKPKESRELSTDEMVMDLYFNAVDEGWRIHANNFDFSCLQNEKRVTVFENIGTLVKVISERAANVEVDESFSRKRALLANVWPVDAMSKSVWSPGTRQKYNYKTVTTSDNELQFDNYSRAVQFLRNQGVADGR
jgi:hypothetical protein